VGFRKQGDVQVIGAVDGSRVDMDDLTSTTDAGADGVTLRLTAEELAAIAIITDEKTNKAVPEALRAALARARRAR